MYSLDELNEHINYERVGSHEGGEVDIWIRASYRDEYGKPTLVDSCLRKDEAEKNSNRDTENREIEGEPWPSTYHEARKAIPRGNCKGNSI